MMDKEKLTVDSFEKILNELSVHGYGDMSIVLGTDTPLLKYSIGINFMTNELLIRNTYYDKKLVDSAKELKDNIDESIKQYLAECHNAAVEQPQESGPMKISRAFFSQMQWLMGVCMEIQRGGWECG